MLSMPNYAVDRQRLAQMTIFEQMGNIGSEVGRAEAYRFRRCVFG